MHHFVRRLMFSSAFSFRITTCPSHLVSSCLPPLSQTGMNIIQDSAHLHYNMIYTRNDLFNMAHFTSHSARNASVVVAVRDVFLSQAASCIVPLLTSSHALLSSPYHLSTKNTLRSSSLMQANRACICVLLC